MNDNPLAAEARRADHDRPLHPRELMNRTHIRLRLLGALIALAGGVTALIIAILLVRSVLG